MADRAHLLWQWTDELGNIIPAADVEVFEPGTTTRIAQTIYVNDDPDTSVYPNPFKSDANGIASFFLTNSRRVDLRFSKTGYDTKTIPSLDATKSSVGVNTVQDEGAPLTTRDILNFTGAGVTATDDAANGRTNVAISSGETVATSTIWDAKGDLAVGTGADTAARLAIGAEGTSPVARAAAATGIAWEAIAGGTSHFILRKTADETVTSSATLQDDDHLTFAIAASEIWVGYMFLDVGAGDEGADIKYDITVPTGATLVRGMHGLVGATTTYSADLQALDPGTGITSWGIDGTERTVAIIYFTVTNGSTAGNVTLQWAQNAASATGTTLKAGSHLVAHKVG